MIKVTATTTTTLLGGSVNSLESRDKTVKAKLLLTVESHDPLGSEHTAVQNVLIEAQKELDSHTAFTKLSVVKIVKELTGLSLMDSKMLVERVMENRSNAATELHYLGYVPGLKGLTAG